MSKKLDKPRMNVQDAHDYNRIVTDYNAQIELLENPEEFDRLPCIRIMADGTIELYDCKTGKPIKQ
jgi:hypothetical protein